MSDEIYPEMDDELVLAEELVVQIDDHVRDTERSMPAMRAGTFSDWPPEPPLPADVDLAQGTLDEAVPPVRKAGIYAAVRRPTTSSEDT